MAGKILMGFRSCGQDFDAVLDTAPRAQFSSKPTTRGWRILLATNPENESGGT